jgi:TM2 domain-containing membrane protein YozV
MKWEVSGADRDTGRDRSMIIDAETEDSARRRGNRQGLLVAFVRPLDPEDSLAGVPAVVPRSSQHVFTRPVPPPPAPPVPGPPPAPTVIYVQAPAAPPPPMPVYQPPPQTIAPVINITNTNVVGGYGRPKRWSRLVAGLLSLVIPGLGQMYKGQVINGLVWLVIVVAGYALLVFPGLVLHLLCVLGAMTGDPYK